MTAAPRLMTLDDYFATPESKLPTELAFGVLRVADSPTPRHQSLVCNLAIMLDEHVRKHRLGKVWISPLDVILDAQKALVVQPDVFVISNERSNMVRDRVLGGPDLVIEVLSPHPRVGKVSEHLAWFARYGVRECWHIHRDDKRVSVFGFANGEIKARHLIGAVDLIPSSVLPDLALSLRDILER